MPKAFFYGRKKKTNGSNVNYVSFNHAHSPDLRLFCADSGGECIFTQIPVFIRQYIDHRRCNCYHVYCSTTKIK